jgi:hypothetical protein
MIDFRDLLLRYIRAEHDYEGVTFINSALAMGGFSDEECAFLIALQAEYDGEELKRYVAERPYLRG